MNKKWLGLGLKEIYIKKDKEQEARREKEASEREERR